LAVVLADKAAVFVDGRYTLQAKAQVEVAFYAQRHLTEEPASDYIAKNLKPGEALGYDPWLLTPGEVERYRAACEKAGGKLKALASNPLDAIWKDRPKPPEAPAVPHPVEFSGISSAEKRRDLAHKLAEDKADAVVLTAPDSICWLLNMRGGDLVYTPVALCFAVLHADASVDLFIDRRKASPALEKHLGKEVRISPTRSARAWRSWARERNACSPIRRLALLGYSTG
jgi:Xaa-Pro aminopeptidase